jgi:predicted nucleic acid-binding protein
MIAYIDSSVLLRVALGQSNALPEWPAIERAVSSALIITECLRTLDRVQLRVNLPDIEVAGRRSTLLALLDSLELVEIDSFVLDRAAQPMPTELGTLDAIHLASALLWKDLMGLDAIMATHDGSLGVAARAHGFKVLGT